METEGSFPNSMVDRITPVTKQQDLEYLQKTFGLRDEWPVVCEPYIQWVVEDRFCNGRPPLEKVGVSFVPDVTPYEKMKIRLLNAGHSVLGIPGAVHGHQTINDCMEDEVLASFMRGFMDLEATPILGEIAGVDLKAYKDCLEQRFSNPNIKDGVSRICSESSAKLPKFLIPTIQENLENGGSIEHGAFVMACWCYYSHKGVDENGKPLEIIDNRKPELHESAKKYASDSLSFLRIPDIFGSLIENERFVEEYSRWLAHIYRGDSIRGLMGQINSRTSDPK
jgi:mannitol 2-dehydrogenase